MLKYYIWCLLFIATLTLFAQQGHKEKIEEFYKNIDLEKLDSIALSLELKNVNRIKLITDFKVNKKGKLVDIHVVALNNNENSYNINQKGNSPFKLLEKEMINYMKGLPKIPPFLVDANPKEKKYLFQLFIDLDAAAEKVHKHKNEY
jgi:hypothetical protein